MSKTSGKQVTRRVEQPNQAETKQTGVTEGSQRQNSGNQNHKTGKQVTNPENKTLEDKPAKEEKENELPEARKPVNKA